MAEALAEAAALGLTGALHGQLHPLEIECLRWSIKHAKDSPCVTQMAEAFALTPAALARELHDQGSPPRPDSSSGAGSSAPPV